jgi:hypothetical protein
LVAGSFENIKENNMCHLIIQYPWWHRLQPVLAGFFHSFLPAIRIWLKLQQAGRGPAADAAHIGDQPG